MKKVTMDFIRMEEMSSTKNLSASLEDYLEAIFHIIAEKRVARAKEISKRLKVGSSSVTGALHALSDRDLIHYVPYDVVTLTSKGERLAEDVIRRHEALRDFFLKVLVVDEGEAEEGACKMEHAVSRTILERFIEFVEFVELCPRGGPEWIKKFKYHCEHECTLDDCDQCVSDSLTELRRKRSSDRNRIAVQVMVKELQPGQRGRIVDLGEAGKSNKQMMEIGLSPGMLIEVERTADPSDLINVKVRGYHLSLRQNEAETIMVEVL